MGEQSLEKGDLIVNGNKKSKCVKKLSPTQIEFLKLIEKENKDSYCEFFGSDVRTALSLRDRGLIEIDAYPDSVEDLPYDSVFYSRLTGLGVEFLKKIEVHCLSQGEKND